MDDVLAQRVSQITALFVFGVLYFALYPRITERQNLPPRKAFRAYLITRPVYNIANAFVSVAVWFAMVFAVVYLWTGDLLWLRLILISLTIITVLVSGAIMTPFGVWVLTKIAELAVRVTWLLIDILEWILDSLRK